MIILLGVVVAIVAVLALRDPNGHSGKSAAAPRTGASSHPSSRTSSKHPSTTSPAKASSSATATTPNPSSGSSDTTSAVKKVPLVVLNNTTIVGLAAEAAKRFEAGGWTVTSSGNLQNTIVSTCAYYDPSIPGAEAAAEALQKQFPTIKRVKQKFPELPAGPVVVVLTPDYSSS